MMVTLKLVCVYALRVTYVDSRQGPVHMDHHLESLMVFGIKIQQPK